MSVMMEFSVYPVGQGESLSSHVARCLAVVESSGLAYKLGPMGTTVEGQTAREVLDVAEKCLTQLQQDFARVEVAIKLDWRAGDEPRLESKLRRVEEKIGHKLRT